MAAGLVCLAAGQAAERESQEEDGGHRSSPDALARSVPVDAPAQDHISAPPQERS
jgi:hypothetical protein